MDDANIARPETPGGGETAGSLAAQFAWVIAESERMAADIRQSTEEFWSTLHIYIAQEDAKRRRSRHPRLHSKGRRSRWPRGVRA